MDNLAPEDTSLHLPLLVRPSAPCLGSVFQYFVVLVHTVWIWRPGYNILVMDTVTLLQKMWNVNNRICHIMFVTYKGASQSSIRGQHVPDMGQEGTWGLGPHTSSRINTGQDIRIDWFCSFGTRILSHSGHLQFLGFEHQGDPFKLWVIMNIDWIYWPLPKYSWHHSIKLPQGRRVVKSPILQM